MSAEYPPEIRSQLYHRLNEMGKAFGVYFNRINVHVKVTMGNSNNGEQIVQSNNL